MICYGQFPNLGSRGYNEIIVKRCRRPFCLANPSTILNHPDITHNDINVGFLFIVSGDERVRNTFFFLFILGRMGKKTNACSKVLLIFDLGYGRGVMLFLILFPVSLWLGVAERVSDPPDPVLTYAFVLFPIRVPIRNGLVSLNTCIISGVLVRLTTCKKITKSLPKLSLTTLDPPETHRDSRSAGYTGGPVSIQDVSFSWVYRREYFSSSTWGKSEKKYYGACGTRTHVPNNTWSVDDAIC